jgi:malate permease and related proteins
MGFRIEMNSAVRQILPILSLVVVGFLLKQIGLFRSGDSQVMARLIINITLPVVIFLSIARANVSPAKMALLAFCGVVVSLGLGVISGAVTRYLHVEQQVAGVIILATMIMNIGFFLYPVFLTVYGQEGISRLAAFDLGNSIVASSYGFYVATRYGKRPPVGYRQSILRVLSLPVLWAVLIGLVVNLLRIPLSPFLTKMLEPLAVANIPLAMLTLGAFLQLRYTRLPLMGLTVALRMGGGFLLGQACVLLAHLQGLDKVAVSMGSAMPVGMAVMVYSINEGLDAEFAAGTISLSILAGLVIMPVLISLY